MIFDKDMIGILVMGGISFFAAIMTAYTIWWRIGFLGRCVRTTGTVMDVKTTVTADLTNRQGLQVKTTYLVQITFNTREGAEHTFWHTSNNSGFGRVWVTGQVLPLCYDPADLGTVMLTRELWSAPAIGVFFFVLFGFAAFMIAQEYHPELITHLSTIINSATGG